MCGAASVWQQRMINDYCSDTMGFHHGKCLQSLCVYNKIGGVNESKIISGIYLESSESRYSCIQEFLLLYFAFFVCNFVS